MSNLTKFSCIFKQLLKTSSTRPLTFANYCKSTDKKDDKADVNEIIRDDDELPVDLKNYLIDDEDAEARRKHIEKLRNKSGLLPQHRRMVRGEIPYDEPQSWVHLTVKYQRKMYGRFGASSGVDPRLMFPTTDDLTDQAEYERLAYPKTVPQMMKEVALRKRTERETILQREEKIAKNLGKLDQWTRDLENRLAKKEAEARAAKEKRERMVIEARREFGFNIDQRDPRLLEYFEQKAEEAKKAKKAVKKQEAEQRLLKKIQENYKTEVETKDDSGSSSSDSESESDDEGKEQKK